MSTLATLSLAKLPGAPALCAPASDRRGTAGDRGIGNAAVAAAPPRLPPPSPPPAAGAVVPASLRLLCSFGLGRVHVA